MKKLFFVPFLLLLLTSFQVKRANGFINRSDPEIKGLICGSKLYMEVLRKNFNLDDIYSGEPQNKIALELKNDEKGYFYYFYIDIKTGLLYQIDKENSNQFLTYVIPNSNLSNPEVFEKGNLFSYKDFISAVENGEVSRVLINPDSGTANFLINGVQNYVNLAPDKDLLKILTENNVDIAVTPTRIKKGNPFKEFLNYFLK